MSGLLILTSFATAATRYVNLNNPAPATPYNTWAGAATRIQDAVDAASAGDVILVTNGVYQGGVAVTNQVTLQSVNGPDVTLIDGAGVIRCVYLANGATLSGFILTNGFADAGGGVKCDGGTVTNCTLLRNSASQTGGGAYKGGLINCTLKGNTAANWGGGAAYCELNNCILMGNSAGQGGGAFGGTLNNCTLTGNFASGTGGGASANYGWFGGAPAYLNNCIVYDNSGNFGSNYDDTCFLNYCCTTPAPGSFTEYTFAGPKLTPTVGNLTNEPLFVDKAGGNLRLQSNSPCINSGYNGYSPAGPDLDGNPRIAGGTVDIGAYEFQSPVSSISYLWLQRYGLPIDGAVDSADPDGDGMNNWQEWHCLTNPTNALSALRILSQTVSSPGITVSWESVTNVSYIVERSTNVSSPLFFTPQPVPFGLSGIPGQPGTTSYHDTNAVGPSPYYYRVGVMY